MRHGEAADWLSARYRARSDLLVFDPARDYIAVCRHPGCHRYADNSLCSAHREQAAVEIALESGLTEELWIARLAPAAPQAEYEQRVPARSRGRW